MNGQRLRQLRLARGWSLAELSSALGGIVTKQALSKYENEKTQPSPRVAEQLASIFALKVADLLDDTRINIVAYRKGTKLSRREQLRLEGLVGEELRARVRLQRVTQDAFRFDFPHQRLGASTVDEIEVAAQTIRHKWCLGQAPIANLMDVLESHGIHVIQIAADDGFEGIAAHATDVEGQLLAASVVIRTGQSGERQRLSVAYELAHLVLKQTGMRKQDEQAAFRFGAALLAPADLLRKEVGEYRTLISPNELLLLKRQFRMSAQALLHRLHDLAIINYAYYTHWCISINQLGWKRNEPESIAPEEPRWLKVTTLRALSEGVITYEEAERILGESLAHEPSMTLLAKRQRMKLPLAERRRVLAQQASRAEADYDIDQDWQGGAFVEQ